MSWANGAVDETADVAGNWRGGGLLIWVLGGRRGEWGGVGWGMGCMYTGETAVVSGGRGRAGGNGEGAKR